MRKQLFLGLAISAALAAGSFAVAAQPDMHGGGDWGGHRGGQHGMLAMRGLQLTDAQKASIKQIMKSGFEQNKGQWQALRKQREALQAMKPSDAGYPSAASALAQAEGAATTARVQRMADLRAKVYAVLTPAQQAQLATRQAQRKARRAQMQERRAQWKQFQAEHPIKGAAQSGQ